MKKKKSLIIIIVILLATPAWAKPVWLPLKEKVIAADLAGDKKEQKRLAKEALGMAADCLEKNREEIGCLYYRAQATGIANQGFFGYVKRLRSMFADWEKVLAIDPTFDYGGPYRMFAEVYMELPKHFGPKDLRQDLDKADGYLQKAIAISNYPTNHLDRAELLIALGKKTEAKQELDLVKKLLFQWKTYPYYASWIDTLNIFTRK